MHPPVLPEKRVKILLGGYGHLGLAVLQGLLACPDLCEVVGVYRWVSTAKGGNYWETIEGEFQKTVETHQLQDIVCPGMNTYEFAVILENLKPDVVLIASWGDILKPHLLECEQPLFINCHPSKLPAHRGANPYASVIRVGEMETGVTFHKIVPEIDAGPIVLQGSVPLDEHETGETIRYKCAELAGQLVPALVERLAVHCLSGAPLALQEQDIAKKSYYPVLKPEDGLIPWEKDVRGVYQHCRAMFPWIACCSFLEGRQQVRLLSPRFVPVQPPVSPAEAGTILSFKRGVVSIALSEPEWVLESPLFQMVGEKGPWPFWLSRLLAPFFFQSGKRFGNKG